MNIYDFVSGPMVWISFGIFFLGILTRVIVYIRGLDWKLDRVTYSVNRMAGYKGAFRSIVTWLIPFGTRSWRSKPAFALTTLLFHLSLLTAPLFVKGHVYLVKERWGVSLRAIPDSVADALTIVMMLSALILLLRRISLPEVRILTTPHNLLVLLISVAPFITGFLAHKQMGDYNFWLIAHIISGEIMLISIPFTKLSHSILFFLSRAQIGMDFGIKRGGMKNERMMW